MNDPKPKFFDTLNFKTIKIVNQPG